MLRASADFTYLSKHGTRRNKALFSIVYCKQPADVEIGMLRLGIVASKKTYKRAVDRNKSKRRVRAMMTQLSAELDLSQLDLLVIVRRGFAEADYATLKNSMRHVILNK